MHSCSSKDQFKGGSVPQPNKKEVKQKKLCTIRKEKDTYLFSTDGAKMIGTENLSSVLDQPKKKYVLGSNDHSYHASKEARDRDNQIYILKMNTDWRTRECKKTHTILNSNQRFKKDTELPPLIFLAPLDFPTPKWQQQQQSQQQQGSRIRSEPTSNFGKAERHPMRDGTRQPWWSDDSKWNTWSAWNQDQWRES